MLRAADYLISESTDTATGRTTPIALPKSNVLSYTLEGGAGLVVRPSGTEPKVKAYVTATGRDKAAADQLAATLATAAAELLKA